MIRAKCKAHGHRYDEHTGLAVEYCRRWFCKGARVKPSLTEVAPYLGSAMEHLLRQQGRLQ